MSLLAFLIALSASLLLTVPVRALAIRVGMVDQPGPRKVHLDPIPLLGGLAIYGAVMIAIFTALDGPARAQSIAIEPCRNHFSPGWPFRCFFLAKDRRSML